MEIVNKIRDGIHLDNNVYDQPENSMRDSLNGIITDEGGGNFKWKNIKGNTLSFVISSNDRYFAHCTIRDRLFIITLNDNETEVRFWEISFVGDVGTANIRNISSNTGFNLSFDYPIRAIWGFYENEDTQRIYFTDDNNPPRCINMGSGSTVVIDYKFTPFAPIINHVYGKFTPLPESTGGTIKAGTYFFAWRYYTSSGYYTDWSQLSNPVMVSDGVPGTTFMAYQNLEGAAPNENTGKSLRFNISDLDTDYNNIQVCAFYSNDLNSAEPGAIIWDGGIGGQSSIDFIYRGNENFGTVTIADLVETSVIIEKCKDMLYAKKKNIIANIKERSELDVSTLTPDQKNNYLPASVTTIKKHILMDTSGYPGVMANSASDKGLFGIPTAATDAANHVLRKGLWYKALSAVVWNNNGIPQNISINNVFYVPTTAVNPTWVSGTYIACIVIKKYRRGGVNATGDETYDANNVYVCDVITLDGEYQDYKSPKISHYLKGYPHGEKVRLGILFFDKTGRPFFVRYLKDTVTGDVSIPLRQAGNEILECLNPTTTSDGTIYNQVNGLVTGLKISSLDITDIVNQIGGFMIVRCPIIHQYLGMGILTPTHVDSNNVYGYNKFSALQYSLKNFPGCYDFVCPEDLFKLKDYAIQAGDEIENLMYLDAFNVNESFDVNGHTFLGFGRRESSYGPVAYQKMYKMSGHTHGTNGAIGASHEVITATPFKVGDNDVPIKPTDLTKLYQARTVEWHIDSLDMVGYMNDHIVLILDIDEGGTNYDLKGTDTFENLSYALLCAHKRPNADPYGGNSDSSLANSLYVATGHFQEINSTVLNNILYNGRYVFNDIEVMGGDTFLSLFDVKRTHYNDDVNYTLSHSVIFPVESRINIAMREGVHIAKDRSYNQTINPNGIIMKVGSTVLEEFNYNDGYSTDNIDDFYIPVPFDYKFTNEYDARIRYSPEKNYGEKQDKFIMFLANDFLDLDTNQGPITNIKYKQDRLVYWQPDEVGYIPINERALTQNAIGQPVQLGIGGLFERYDQIVEKIGNCNQFGLIESPIGYHWYDARRKIFMTLDLGLRLTPDSIVKGLDSFFQTIPSSFEYLDNPMHDYGVFGGYDPATRIVMYTFYLQGGTNYTIGIHSSLNKVAGFFQLYPRSYITFKGSLFEGNNVNKSMYKHGINNVRHNFFGTQYESRVSIIVKENSDIAKIFDTFEMIGNQNFFTSILYENSGQSIEEIIAQYPSDICTIINRNYEFRNRRWFGNFPKVNRERLTDGYLKITFKMNDHNPVELYELKSNVRKMY